MFVLPPLGFGPCESLEKQLRLLDNFLSAMDETEACYQLTAAEKNELLGRADVCLANGYEPQPGHSNGDLALLLKALNFAALKHSTQRRKDPEKTPYINHPIGVAHILTSEGGVTDVTVLQVSRLFQD